MKKEPKVFDVYFDNGFYRIDNITETIEYMPGCFRDGMIYSKQIGFFEYVWRSMGLGLPGDRKVRAAYEICERDIPTEQKRALFEALR